MLVPGRRVVAFAWCLATINYSTKNLDYLETHDWLGREANRTIVQFPLPGSAPV